MRDLNRFWQSLERIQGLKAAPAFWAELCGPHFSLIRPYLQATDTIGALYPCPHPSSGHCPRRIVDYGEGHYAAICRDPYKVCPDLTLEPRDVVVHELGVGCCGLRAGPRGAAWHPMAATCGAGRWDVGCWDFVSAEHSRAKPVFLIVLPATARFRGAVERLLFDLPGRSLSWRQRTVIAAWRSRNMPNAGD